MSGMIEKPISKHTIGSRKWAKPATYAGLLVIMCLLPLFIGSPYMVHVFILTRNSYRAKANSDDNVYESQDKNVNPIERFYE